jgi:hypothetical protein
MLKEKLKAQGLVLRGSTEEHRQRLKLSDIQSTLEYKQIMEKDCRERRKRFDEYRKEKGIEESRSDEFTRHYNKYEEVSQVAAMMFGDATSFGSGGGGCGKELVKIKLGLEVGLPESKSSRVRPRS